MATYLKRASIRELRDLFVMHNADLEGRVSAMIADMRGDDGRIVEKFGKPVLDADVLEIGPGQRSPFRYFYSAQNRYKGIDIEPAQDGSLLLNFVDDVRNRGAYRGVKTLGRRLLGLDRKFRKEMLSQLKTKGLHGDILCMDAEQMTFADESVDVVVSTSVFEHLPDPEKVIAEVSRVLRPGGVAHIKTHLFTCDSGIHDTRIFRGIRDDIPFWSHLRPDHRHKVESNSYLNEIRLAEYRRIFDLHWDGVEHIVCEDAPQNLRQELTRLRELGELSDFTDQELLSSALISVWKKPAA